MSFDPTVTGVAQPALTALPRRSTVVAPPGSSGAFGAVLDAAQADSRASNAASVAQSQVGSTVTASGPAGGCRCGTLVQQAYDAPARPRLPAEPGAMLQLGQAVPAQPDRVRRGDIVISEDQNRPGVLHAAVALSSTTAATVDPRGVVVSTPITWGLVRTVRRV